jgi:alkylation response protein AidB-like acyl-CoA dehydrogenase
VDFAFTDDQARARDGAIRFARAELSGGVVDHQKFPWEKWKKSADFGLFKLFVPEEYGGAAVDCITAAAILEGLGYGCSDRGFVHAISAHLVASLQLAIFGSDAQKRAYLPAMCRGEKVACQAITEPGAGSDMASMQTRGKLEGDAWVLSGTKSYSSNLPIAHLSLVFAVTNPALPGLGRMSCFIVELDDKGVGRSAPFKKLGLDTLQNGELYLDQCAVARDRLLGAEGAAGAILLESMDWERIIFFASEVGCLRRQLERTVKFAKQRRQFGKSIGEFQAISHKIADMQVRLQLGELMVYKAAWLKAQKKSATLEASIVKLFVSEASQIGARDMLQIHGALGYIEESGVPVDLRDTAALTILSGTSEIQRNIIAKLSGL